MIYVQFYQKGVMTGDTIEACGDRSVVVLDGRCTRDWLMDIATDECEKRGFIAWRLFKGDSFTRSTPISPLMEKLA
jgi:hypothetical protein